jgi:hypothetical protein
MAVLLPTPNEPRTARTVWNALVPLSKACSRAHQAEGLNHRSRGQRPRNEASDKIHLPQASRADLKTRAFLTKYSDFWPFPQANQAYLRLIKPYQAKIKIVVFSSHIPRCVRGGNREVPWHLDRKKPFLQNEPNLKMPTPCK